MFIVTPLLILLLLIGVLLILLMIVNIKIGLFIFFVTLPFQNVYIYIDPLRMFLSLSDIFAALIFFAWLLMLFLNRAELPSARPLVFIGILWLITLIGCFTSIEPVTSLKFSFRLLSYFAVFAVLLSVMNNYSYVRLVLVAMSIQLLLVSAVTNWKYITSDVSIEQVTDIDEEAEQSLVRQGGIARDMNTTAFDITILLPLTIALSISEKRKILYLIIMLAISALLITMSRSGWIAFVISLFFLPKMSLRQVIVVSIIFITIFTVFYRLFFGRIEATNLESDSISARLQMYEFTWYLFKENPLLGIGGGNFSMNAYRVYNELASRVYLQKGYCSPHNQYLGLLAENGIIAFTVYIAFLIYISGFILDKKPFKDEKLNTLRRGIMASFVALIVFQLFLYFGLRNYLYWSVIALVYCIHHIAMKDSIKNEISRIRETNLPKKSGYGEYFENMEFILDESSE